jgi:hypothetical protein
MDHEERKRVKAHKLAGNGLASFYRIGFVLAFHGGIWGVFRRGFWATTEMELGWALYSPDLGIGVKSACAIGSGLRGRF